MGYDHRNDMMTMAAWHFFSALALCPAATKPAPTCRG
jgi:hypothetical protein